MIGTLPRGVGSTLDAADLDPFWQAADETGALIHIHPSFDAGDVRVNDFGLANGLGRITDAVVAVARLICAGHVARYKNAKFFAPMGAAALPFVLGRLKRNAAITPGIGDPVASAVADLYRHYPARCARAEIRRRDDRRRPSDVGLRHAVPDRRPGADEDRRRGWLLEGADRIRSTAGWRPGYSEFNDKTKDQRSKAMNKRPRGGSQMTGLSTLLRCRAWRARSRRADRPCACRSASAGQSHHRRVRLSLARRLHAAGDQGARNSTAKHGLDIEFVERPPDAYTTQFNSGEFKVGGSAAVLTVGLADARGVKVKYLFNLFDFWGTVVTSRPEVKTVKDLEGKQLAAACIDHQFRDVRVLCQEARRRRVEGAGGQYRAARPCRLCARRPRRRHPALGAGLYAVEGEEARRSGRSTPR